MTPTALGCARGLSLETVVSGPIRVLSVLNAAERDGAFMEPSGRNRWQPVQMDGRESGSDRRIALPWVATGCRDPKNGKGGALPLRKGGVASLAPHEVPSPANPKAHRT
jgi:hypothetical protein